MDISQSFKALKEAILKERDVNVVPKSIIHDIFLVPTATELTKLKILISYVSGLQSFESIINLLNNTTFLEQVSEALEVTIDDIKFLTSGALDKLAANYNKTRKPASKATGVVNFYRPNPLEPEELNKEIAAGTIVYTGAGVEYQVTVNVPYRNYYFDTILNAYVVDAPVECTVAGSIGNTLEYTITKIKTAVEGFGNVTNKTAITNGLDPETDIDFATRLKTEISGNNVGTINGIKNVILQNFSGISDLIVVGSNDPIMVRDLGWGGKIDVYILEKNWDQYSWTFDYGGEDVTYIQGLRPISSSLPVRINPSGTGIVFSDSTTAYAKSIYSRDYIVWQTKPPVGPVTLTYFYDKNIQDIQDFINRDEYNTGADVLIKQATEVPVDIIFEIVVFEGYSKAMIIDTIKNIIKNFINSLRLGESLDQSDIIAKAYSVDGIDRVVLPMSKFNRSTEMGVVDKIEVSKNEYIRIGTLNIG